MKLELVDTHTHLDDRAFHADLPAVLAGAQAAGVTRLVTVGTDLPSCRPNRCSRSWRRRSWKKSWNG